MMNEIARSQLRDNMVEQQIRPWDVLDESVLAVFRDAEREDFVPDPALKSLAYADMALPIGFGQSMLEPKMEARMLQALAPAPDERILHVGTGSGFFASLVARMAGEVVSVEIVPQLAESARERLGGLSNVSVESGDGLSRSGAEPFHAAVLTGSVPFLPPDLWSRVLPGGRIIAVEGASPAMTLVLSRRRLDGAVLRREILETCIPPLRNAPQPPRFEF